MRPNAFTFTHGLPPHLRPQDSTWLIDPYWTLIPPMIGAFYWAHPGASPDPTRSLVVTTLLWVWSTRLTHSYFRREVWGVCFGSDTLCILRSALIRGCLTVTPRRNDCTDWRLSLCVLLPPSLHNPGVLRTPFTDSRCIAITCCSHLPCTTFASCITPACCSHQPYTTLRNMDHIPQEWQIGAREDWRFSAMRSAVGEKHW